MSRRLPVSFIHFQNVNDRLKSLHMHVILYADDDDRIRFARGSNNSFKLKCGVAVLFRQHWRLGRTRPPRSDLHKEY